MPDRTDDAPSREGFPHEPPNPRRSRTRPQARQTFRARRRTGAIAAALIGAASPAATALGGPHGDPLTPPGRLGIQLYTLRDKVATHGFAKVFAELAAYGYAEIEYAGYTQGSAGAIGLARLRRLAHDHGLRGPGSPVGHHDDNDPNAHTFAQNLIRVLDDAQELGLAHIGTAPGPFRYGSAVDAWKRAAEDFNTYGAAARARGMRGFPVRSRGAPADDAPAHPREHRCERPAPSPCAPPRTRCVREVVRWRTREPEEAAARH